MNILHHKSYHVYNKKNIERVKRDEAEAEKETKAKQDKVILAESEARLALLRKRAGVDNDNHNSQPLDLFKDRVENKNEEHVAEEKEKDEKWERQITMYLDKGAKKEDEPWYINQKDEDKYVDKYAFKRKEDKDSKRRKRDPIKVADDPLEIITSTLKKREEKREGKHKKSRHHKERKERSSKSSSSMSIEELRAKRLERERAEKVRVRELYLGPIEQQEELDDRKRSYNSQFNREETYQAHHASNKKRRYDD